MAARSANGRPRETLLEKALNHSAMVEAISLMTNTTEPRIDALSRRVTTMRKDKDANVLLAAVERKARQTRVFTTPKDRQAFTESKAGQEVLKLFELGFLSELSEKTIELSGKLNVAHQEATKKDKSTSELSGKLNDAHQEATKKDKSISELSGNLSDMQPELAHIKSDLNSANDQKRELQKALKEFNSDLNGKEQHLQSTRSQLVFEKAEHERLATEVDVKNGIINELQGRTEEAVRRIEDSEKELTQLRGERATLKASHQEATQVREAKAALATQLKSSHAELDKL